MRAQLQATAQHIMPHAHAHASLRYYHDHDAGGVGVVPYAYEGTAMESGPGTSSKSFFYKPVSSSSARRCQKERQHSTVRKKVSYRYRWPWCRAIPFQHFPKENVIFKAARISIPTTRVFGKYPRVTLRYNSDPARRRF